MVSKVRPKDDIAKVARAVEEHEKSQAKRLMLKSGVEVGIRRLPPLLVYRLEEQFPDPPPPMVAVTVRGKTEVQPNPDDPDYQKELQRVKMRKGTAYLNLAMARGIDFELPADDEWLEGLRAIGIEVGDSEVEKRIAYAQSVLILDVDDLTEVASRVLVLSGVTPQAVDLATKKVPG
jgi:hypothetical protein